MGFTIREPQPAEMEPLGDLVVAAYDAIGVARKAVISAEENYRISQERYKPASGVATVCGVYVETDPRTGKATRVEPIRIGGRLSETVPVIEAARADA